MNFYALLSVAIALSLDAFGVSLSIGLDKSVRSKDKIKFAISFGFFQFLFALLGSYFGVLFDKYIVDVPKIMGGVIIAIVGILMIRDGLKKKVENLIISPGIFIILGISVSIDAFVIGFTVLNSILFDVVIIYDSLFIGFVTLCFCLLSFIICKFLKKIYIISKYANYLGGIILIFFGIKMIFS